MGLSQKLSDYLPPAAVTTVTLGLYETLDQQKLVDLGAWKAVVYRITFLCTALITYVVVTWLCDVVLRRMRLGPTYSYIGTWYEEVDGCPDVCVFDITYSDELRAVGYIYDERCDPIACWFAEEMVVKKYRIIYKFKGRFFNSTKQVDGFAELEKSFRHSGRGIVIDVIQDDDRQGADKSFSFERVDRRTIKRAIGKSRPRNADDFRAIVLELKRIRAEQAVTRPNCC